MEIKLDSFKTQNIKKEGEIIMEKNKAREIAEKRVLVEDKARYGSVNVRGTNDRGSGGIPIRGTSTILVDSEDDRFDSIGSRIYFEADSNWGRKSSFLYAGSRDWSDSTGVYLSGNNRDERGSEIESSGFTIYFSSRKEVEELTKALLDELDIQEATKEYKKELALAQCTNYEPELHPETFVAYPNLKEKLLIETGEYYWNSSKGILEEITEDTPKEILDKCWDYNVNEDTGEREDDWGNKNAREHLSRLSLPEVRKTWQIEPYPNAKKVEIDVPRLATHVGAYDRGYYHSKVRVEGDKRRKMWRTTFVYQDRTTVTVDGKWELSSRGYDGMELSEDINSQYQREELYQLGLI